MGNPGYTAVFTSTELIVSNFRLTLRPFVVLDISTPASVSLPQNASKSSIFPPISSTSPPAITGASIYVPSSIRSIITECVVPFNLSTPLIVIVSVPSPEIFAPIDLRHVTKSTISGSIAAFFSWDLPFARQAAITKFSVAPTDANFNLCSPPTNLPLLGVCACRYPSFNSISAPSARRAEICKSIGLAPIAQPPGNETMASPALASRGPRTKFDARIFLTIS